MLTGSRFLLSVPSGTVVPPGYRDRGPTRLPGPWSHSATGTVVPRGYRDRGPTLLPGPWSHSATGTVVPLCYRDRGPTLLPHRVKRITPCGNI